MPDQATQSSDPHVRTRVQITSGHIDEAYPGDCESCVLALAVKDRLVDGWRVMVGSNVIYFIRDMPHAELETLLSPAADRLRKAFDALQKVEPQVVEVSIPVICLKGESGDE